jgi:hypothetical protein
MVKYNPYGLIYPCLEGNFHREAAKNVKGLDLVTQKKVGRDNIQSLLLYKIGKRAGWHPAPQYLYGCSSGRANQQFALQRRTNWQLVLHKVIESKRAGCYPALQGR